MPGSAMTDLSTTPPSVATVLKPPERPAAARLADRAADRAARLAAAYGPLALRCALGLVFVWFGALKVTGDSPVTGLVHETLPWFPIGPLMLALGLAEVLFGVALLAGRPL